MAKPVTVVAVGAKPIVNTSVGQPATSIVAGGLPITLVSALGMPMALVKEDGTAWGTYSISGIAGHNMRDNTAPVAGVSFGAAETGRRMYILTLPQGGTPSAITLGDASLTRDHTASLLTNRDWEVWSGTPTGTSGTLTVTTASTTASPYLVFRTVGLTAASPVVTDAELEDSSNENEADVTAAISSGVLLLGGKRYFTLTGTGVTETASLTGTTLSWVMGYASSTTGTTITAAFNRTGLGSTTGKMAAAFLLVPTS